MKVAVYDTYARTDADEVLHFDVLLPEDQGKLAVDYARRWLADIGIAAEHVQLQSCRYCHSQTPTPEIIQSIEKHGYFILQMEGCPSPV